MTENEKKRSLQALDLLVYAPLGLALAVRDELPRFVERGRTQVEARVTMAQVVGRFAVGYGQREVARRLGVRSTPGRPAPSASAASGRSGTAPRVEAGNGVRPSAAHLAIPGYDALAASQVVQRLPGLSPGELEAVRAYETATRRRKTVLARISRLQPGIGNE